MHSAQRLLFAVGLAVLSASSFAATTVYTSSASFMANVQPGSYTETFTGLSNPPVGPALFSSGGFAYSASTPGDIYLEGGLLSTSLPDNALTVTFTSGNVTAVGGNFYATNLSDAFHSVAITLTLSDSTSVTFTPTSASDSYRGFASDVTITSLSMNSPGVSLYASIDNLTIGAAVPEPASWALMGLGVAGLLVVRRRTTKA